MIKSIEEIKADYHLFMDIQMGKYLKSKNKSAFSSDEEAGIIMKRIIDVYNDLIAPDHHRLDNSDETAKISWFNSVEIDFQNSGSKPPHSNNIPDMRKITNELILYYNEMFPFLPEGSILYLINAGPALGAFGYPPNRLEDLLQGKEPTEFEKEILRWACDLAFKVTDAFLENDKFKKEKKLIQAILIAKEKLDEDTSVDVISDIYAGVESNFAERKKGRNRSKSKPKKKKKK